MKGKVNIPEDFELFRDEEDSVFLLDDYGEIKEHVKEAIYLKPLFTHIFIDDGLYCMVWWNDQLGYWCAEVYVNWDYEETYICETLEELTAEIEQDYEQK